jgi:hypothetical protein
VAKMQLINKVQKSLQYYLMEKMETNGLTSGRYSVIDSYPNLALTNVFPTISVERVSMFAHPIQIGSHDGMSMHITLDLICNSENQLNDLLNILWDNLHKKYISIYDLNDGFPTAFNYTGIDKLGEFYVESFASTHLTPEVFEKTEQKKYWELITMVISVPNII